MQTSFVGFRPSTDLGATALNELYAAEFVPHDELVIFGHGTFMEAVAAKVLAVQVRGGGLVYLVKRNELFGLALRRPVDGTLQCTKAGTVKVFGSVAALAAALGFEPGDFSK